MKIEKTKLMTVKKTFNMKKLPKEYFATKADLNNPALRSASPKNPGKILSVRYYE